MVASMKRLALFTLILYLFSMFPVNAASAATIEEVVLPNLNDIKQIERISAFATLDYDYGDAPDPSYQTLFVNGGASHMLGTDVYLGACVDAETDGQPDVNATGDDGNFGAYVYGTCAGDDDEDGVVFTSGIRAGETATLDVTANAACYLSAWMDFNADGDWQDAGEQIFTDQSLVSGVNSLNINVPAGIVGGNSFARFRCTTDAGISYTGTATDGEVEDYQVTLIDPGPEIDVQRTSGTSITNGSTDLIGNPGVGTIQFSYVVDNSAGANVLDVSSISVNNLTNVSGYTPGSAASFTVPAGDDTTFDFSIDIDAAGSFSFDVNINSNDGDESPYVIHVAGNAYELQVLGTGATSPGNGNILSVSPENIKVQFNKDVLADGSTGAANYTGNYMLVEAGLNAVFDTSTCLAGVIQDDVSIGIDQVNYDEATHTATLDINGGVDLVSGSYRLFVCGTTSVEDLFGFELNNGAADTQISFTLRQANAQSALLPNTGFPQGMTTKLPTQSEKFAYGSTGLQLDIPEISLSVPIVGIPRVDEQWDVSWLGQTAGYLNGTAFPTWMGNTVLTGHVWDANNQPGVFADLKTLQYGDKIKIHAWGQTYTYEIRENMLIGNKNVDMVMQHEDLDWVTLLTCEGYNADEQTYPFRRMVRAVLVDIQ